MFQSVSQHALRDPQDPRGQALIPPGTHHGLFDHLRFQLADRFRKFPCSGNCFVIRFKITDWIRTMDFHNNRFLSIPGSWVNGLNAYIMPRFILSFNSPERAQSRDKGTSYGFVDPNTFLSVFRLERSGRPLFSAGRNR